MLIAGDQEVPAGRHVVIGREDRPPLEPVLHASREDHESLGIHLGHGIAGVDDFLGRGERPHRLRVGDLMDGEAATQHDLELLVGGDRKNGCLNSTGPAEVHQPDAPGSDRGRITDRRLR
ncbi:MAG: hypothetical protein HY700_08780 [Gemmatimonadetes bacterium]|nr:hypothetical protein [Gemmatimonadota bacterium]